MELDYVIRATCRGDKLGAQEWRSLADYYKSEGLASVPSPGPITDVTLMYATTNPLPGIREVGMWLAQYLERANESAPQ